jgi:hypothetical protein
VRRTVFDMAPASDAGSDGGAADGAAPDAAGYQP